MKKNSNTRTNKAKTLVKDIVERVLDVYECRDFVEITGKTGGDVVTFRVYDDGRITER